MKFGEFMAAIRKGELPHVFLLSGEEPYYIDKAKGALLGRLFPDGVGMEDGRYMQEIATGKSSLLKNVTSGFHYHTIRADSEEILDMIQEELGRQGFLAKLQDYEPVDFWNKEA